MGLDQPTVGIVGGTGRMGSWFTDLLEGLGLEVLKCGRSTKLRPEQLPSICNVVVISVPIREMVDVIKNIGPMLPKDALLMDLTSIKTEPVAAMLKYSQAQVVGLHPLFGPKATKGHSPLKVAICPGRGETGLNWTIEIIKAAGLKPLLVSPQLHDQLMSVIQGAQHFAMIAFALTIMHSGCELEDLRRFATPSFSQMTNRVEAILEQPPELFGPLMMDNPFSLESIQSHMQCSEQLKEIVHRKDMQSFRELFLSLTEYFKKGGNQS